MRLEELKKGFWGYQRDAVFQYIAQQEEQFSQKMEEKNAQMERLSQRDRVRIQELEQENRTLKEELERLRGRQEQISQAILDARSSAETLRAESQEQEEAARETVRQALERDQAVLDNYRKQIAALRQTIQETMARMDRQSEEMEHRAEELLEAAPEGNLTLFQ